MTVGNGPADNWVSIRRFSASSEAQEVRHWSAAQSCSRAMYPSSIRAWPLMSGRVAALFVPQGEAPHMELNPFAARRADPFHDELRLGDDFLAGVTRLTRTSSAPNARNTVLRKPTIGELASDQEPKAVLLHEVPLGWASVPDGAMPDSPGPWRNDANPEGPGAGNGIVWLTPL